MSDLDVLRRIRAWAAGAPVPYGKTLRVRRPGPHDLRLAFVRMGGEAAPWAVGWIEGRGRAHFLEVAEARNRDAVAQMMAEFAPVLLAHLGHPDHAGRRTQRGALWVPGPSHLEMLQNLAITYQLAASAPEPRRAVLNALSRVATWLFRESQRAGQLAVVDASSALREHFAFPADDIRQQHLGFLLAWLQAGTRDERLLRAQAAERLSVATTLDPVLERDVLEPRVEKLRTSSGAQLANLTSEISGVLERELAARLERLESARDVLERDPRPENPGLESLQEMLDRTYARYLAMETELAAGKKAFVPNPVADHGPVQPALAMRWQEAYQTVTERALVHHDEDLQAEWVATGEALAGVVVKVTDEGEGRRSVPVWVVESPGRGPLKLRPGATVVVAEEEGRTGEIRDIREATSGRRVEVEITGWKNGPREPRPGVLPAADDRQKGRRVVLLESGPDPVAMLLKSHFGERNGPGSWLTRKLTKVEKSEEVEA